MAKACTAREVMGGSVRRHAYFPALLHERSALATGRRINNLHKKAAVGSYVAMGGSHRTAHHPRITCATGLPGGITFGPAFYPLRDCHDCLKFDPQYPVH